MPPLFGEQYSCAFYFCKYIVYCCNLPLRVCVLILWVMWGNEFWAPDIRIRYQLFESFKNNCLRYLLRYNESPHNLVAENHHHFVVVCCIFQSRGGWLGSASQFSLDTSHWWQSDDWWRSHCLCLTKFCLFNYFVASDLTCSKFE